MYVSVCFFFQFASFRHVAVSNRQPHFGLLHFFFCIARVNNCTADCGGLSQPIHYNRFCFVSVVVVVSANRSVFVPFSIRSHSLNETKVSR